MRRVVIESLVLDYSLVLTMSQDNHTEAHICEFVKNNATTIDVECWDNCLFHTYAYLITRRIMTLYPTSAPLREVQSDRRICGLVLDGSEGIGLESIDPMTIEPEQFEMSLISDIAPAPIHQYRWN